MLGLTMTTTEDDDGDGAVGAANGRPERRVSRIEQVLPTLATK